MSSIIAHSTVYRGFRLRVVYDPYKGFTYLITDADTRIASNRSYSTAKDTLRAARRLVKIATTSAD